MIINSILWLFEKFFLGIAGVGFGLAAMTAADMLGLIVPGFNVISYATQWLCIWSAVGAVGFLITLGFATWRDRHNERRKPFSLQASWVLGKDCDNCFVPRGAGSLGPALCDRIQWKGRNWITIEASFPGWTPVRKTNAVKAYFCEVTK